MVLGWYKHIFNISCLFLSSWILRIIYPSLFNLVYESDNQIENPLARVPPPSYSNAIEMPRVADTEESAPPPTYDDTLSSIRGQLPKFSRSFSQNVQKLPKFSRMISESAHRYGRQLSNTSTASNITTTS